MDPTGSAVQLVEEADWPHAAPEDVPAHPDRFAAERAAYIDAIADSERRLAAAHRDRAVAVAAAQAFSERMVLPGMPMTDAQGDGHEVAARSLRAEVACALRVPEVTASQLLLQSTMLVLRLPQTLATLGAGKTAIHTHAPWSMRS